MAVTNEELIAALEMQCIEEGLMQADESLHTFQVWKSMGYSVRKGEKALISGTIWKYRERKNKQEDENGETTDGGGYCFLKTAYLFATHQVDKKQ